VPQVESLEITSFVNFFNSVPLGEFLNIDLLRALLAAKKVSQLDTIDFAESQNRKKTNTNSNTT